MKRFFVLINLGLTTAIIYLGVAAFYKYETGKMAVGPENAFQNQTSQANASTQSQPLSSYRAIESRNLFDVRIHEPTPTPAATPTPKPDDIDSMKKTDLKLKLFGTVFFGEENKSNRAIIADSKNKQKLYWVGDRVENAFINKIFREKVILNVNGANEVLKIEKATDGRGKKMLPRAPGVMRKPPASKPSRTKGRRTKIKVSRNEIEKSMSNLNQVFRQVRVRPHFYNGKPDGLTISGIKPRSIFRKLGLRSGDVILGVDGQEIRSVNDAVKFYRSLGENPNLQLQIKRRGMPRTIDYEIR